MAVSDTLHGVLDKILAFVDKPWKAVTLIAVILIGGLLYIVYLQREQLTEALVSKNVEKRFPSLRPELYATQIPLLLAKSGADSISVYSLDMATNSLTPRFSRTQPGVELPDLSPRSVIVSNDDAALFLSLFQTRYVCFNPRDVPRQEAEEDVRRGMNRVCLVMIPPGPPLALGLMVIGWKIPPNPIHEREVVLEAQGTSERISTY